MPDEPAELAVDIRFAVPFVHRLRVTDDITGADADQLIELIQPSGGGSAKVLVVGERVLRQQVGKIASQLAAVSAIDLVRSPIDVEGGEEVKNSSVTVEHLLQQINQADLDRRSYIVAVGGGAMLDAVGYAAAIAHRGIRLIRVPTTTLAQGDSGVGVKNAINYFNKKNWVGTFAVPWAVINDSGLLTTLSDRDFRSGFSEAVKVSLLKSDEDFDWLSRHAGDICRRQADVCKQAIHRSCMWHLRHITEGGDPFEMLEARPLDFGHWSAHRLEPLSDYDIRHGEAVGIGVAIDCLYSSQKFGLAEAAAVRVCQCLADLGIPLWHDALQPIDRLLQGLEEFRQHLGGRLTITMLRAIGDPINVHQIDPDAMKAAINRLHELQKTLAASSK